jgi:hypothetical protein
LAADCLGRAFRRGQTGRELHELFRVRPDNRAAMELPGYGDRRQP